MVVQPNPELADKIQSLHSVTWDEMLEVVLRPSIAPGGWVHPSERDHRPSRIVVEGTTATRRQLMSSSIPPTRFIQTKEHGDWVQPFSLV